jgi:2-polyprenyl-3-methyl-5-hydroxy-6-metoxy-1,4-benzoquinol methylase
MCGSATRDILHKGLRDNVFFCAPGAWDMWRCGDCDCAYLDPRPSADTIVLAYQSYFTHNVPAEASTAAPSRLTAWRRALANGYRNWRFGSKFEPASKFGVPLIAALPSARRAILQSFRYLPRSKDGTTPRLLDVGCGDASFLEAAIAGGWQGSGCDFDPVTVRNALARGIDVREGGILAWADQAGAFDAVTISHVIEHVHDPKETLALAWKLLKPGGMIYVETPNLDALGHRLYGRDWRGLEPPRHLILFNWKAMRRELKRAGFHRLRRIARPGVFRGMAAQSELMRAGEDPARAGGLPVRAPDLKVRLRSALARDKSEFVTFTAFKPES